MSSLDEAKRKIAGTAPDLKKATYTRQEVNELLQQAVVDAMNAGEEIGKAEGAMSRARLYRELQRTADLYEETAHEAIESGDPRKAQVTATLAVSARLEALGFAITNATNG